MKTFAFLLQIQELFEGRFNWHGLLLLALFVLMGLIAVVFPIYAGFKAFQSKPKNKNDA